MSFKQNLLLIMYEKNLRPSKLERKAGLAPSTIRKIIDSPHPNPTLKTLIAICKTLNCSIDELCGHKLDKL